MSAAERKAKDAERNQRNRAEKKAKLAAAAAVPGAVQAPRSFDAALQHVATGAALGDVERDDFGDWLLDAELWPDEESLGMIIRMGLNSQAVWQSKILSTTLWHVTFACIAMGDQRSRL